jgi:hypothetical protein
VPLAAGLAGALGAAVGHLVRLRSPARMENHRVASASLCADALRICPPLFVDAE